MMKNHLLAGAVFGSLLAAAVMPAPPERRQDDYFVAHHRKKFAGAELSDMAEC